MTEQRVQFPTITKDDPLFGIRVEKVLELVVDVLRANQLHQGHCAALAVAKANTAGGPYFLPKLCDCWLADQP